MMRLSRSSLLLAAVFALACASSPGGSPVPSQRTSPPPTDVAPPGWSVYTREHVDLWWHGLAMLTTDTAKVPIFQRGYRERVRAIKQRQNAYTNLDANQDKLAAAISSDPRLVNAQFVAMYFATFAELSQATTFFLQSGGNPRSASDPQMQRDIAVLAQTFATPAERDFLRLFVQSLQDESNRFYHAYWIAEQQRRVGGINAVEQQWRSAMYTKFKGFLGHSQQLRGELILSLPLGGEGRTIVEDGGSAVAVDFPETAAEANAAFYVFAHEVVSRTTEVAIADNVTPAEKRAGLDARYSPLATVRGGAVLLQHIAPELVQGYMRYYLAAAGVTPAASGDVSAQFASTFALPQSMMDAIQKEIEGVLGGI